MHWLLTLHHLRGHQRDPAADSRPAPSPECTLRSCTRFSPLASSFGVSVGGDPWLGLARRRPCEMSQRDQRDRPRRGLVSRLDGSGRGTRGRADAGSANKSRPWRSIVFSPLGDGQRRRRVQTPCASCSVGRRGTQPRHRAANSHLELSISNALHPPPNGVKWLVTTVDFAGTSAPLRCWRSWPFSPGDGASPATWCSRGRRTRAQCGHSAAAWAPGRAPVESLAQRPWARGPGGSHRHRHRRRLRGLPYLSRSFASSRRAGDRHLGRRSAGPW